jgi:hypothetical protein
MNDCPVLSMTANRLTEVMAEITHSPRDTLDKVDPAKPALVAEVLRDRICELAAV